MKGSQHRVDEEVIDIKDSDGADSYDAVAADAEDETDVVEEPSSLSRIAAHSLEDIWADLVDFSGKSATKVRNVLSRWQGPSEALPFRPLRRDPCLTEQFINFERKEKAAHDAATAAAAFAGAAAHAVLTAAKKLADVEEILRSIQAGVETDNPDWAVCAGSAADSVATGIFNPLIDAARLHAATYSKSTMAVRSGVISTGGAHITTVLKDSLPATILAIPRLVWRVRCSSKFLWRKWTR